MWTPSQCSGFPPLLLNVATGFQKIMWEIVLHGLNFLILVYWSCNHLVQWSQSSRNQPHCMIRHKFILDYAQYICNVDWNNKDQNPYFDTRPLNIRESWPPSHHSFIWYGFVGNIPRKNVWTCQITTCQPTRSENVAHWGFGQFKLSWSVAVLSVHSSVAWVEHMQLVVGFRRGKHPVLPAREFVHQRGCQQQWEPQPAPAHMNCSATKSVESTATFFLSIQATSLLRVSIKFYILKALKLLCFTEKPENATQ